MHLHITGATIAIQWSSNDTNNLLSMNILQCICPICHGWHVALVRPLILIIAFAYTAWPV